MTDEELSKQRARECAMTLYGLSIEESADYITRMLETAYLDGYSDGVNMVKGELKKNAEVTKAQASFITELQEQVTDLRASVKEAQNDAQEWKRNSRLTIEQLKRPLGPPREN